MNKLRSILADGAIPAFMPERYESVALNELVTYAVYFLSQFEIEITAEDIVAACFMLFPNRFAMRGYSQWPDSTVVNKRWIDCRKRGLIAGSAAKGFVLTPKGLKLAEKIASHLGSDPEKPPHKTLSSREFEVFRLIASGKSVHKIAGELSLSPATISTYRTRILEKMSLNSNAELTRYAFQRGILK